VSHGRFHTIVGALFGTTALTPVVYGIIEPRESARHVPVMVEPGDMGVPAGGRHAILAVNPGFIGAIKASRHTSVMVKPAHAAGLYTSRHTVVSDGFSAVDWSVAVDAVDKFDGFVTMLRPGETYDDIEYSLDGGAWVSTGVTSGSATFVIPGATGTAVRLRAVISAVATAPSNSVVCAPLKVVGVWGSVSAVTTFDTSAYVFDGAKSYLVLVTGLRSVPAAMTLSVNVGLAGRAPGAGTDFAVQASAVSPSNNPNTSAFIVSGMSGSLTLRVASSLSSTTLSVCLYEFEGAWAGIGASAGTGADSGTATLTVSAFTPASLPAVVINFMSLRSQVNIPSYIVSTGNIVQGNVFTPAFIDQAPGFFWPILRVQRMTAASDVQTANGVSVRRAFLVAELT